MRSPCASARTANVAKHTTNQTNLRMADLLFATARIVHLADAFYTVCCTIHLNGAVEYCELLSPHIGVDGGTYRAPDGVGPRRPQIPGGAREISGVVHTDILPFPRELSSLRRPSHVAGPPACPQGVERR